MVKKQPESVARDYQFSYILDGQHWQMRAARLDAANRAADKACAPLFSQHRELLNGGHGPSDEERTAVRLMARALVYVRWWPLEIALELAEAEENGMVGGRKINPEHARKRLEWLNKPKP